MDYADSPSRRKLLLDYMDLVNVDALLDMDKSAVSVYGHPLSALYHAARHSLLHSREDTYPYRAPFPPSFLPEKPVDTGDRIFDYAWMWLQAISQLLYGIALDPSLVEFAKVESAFDMPLPLVLLNREGRWLAANTQCQMYGPGSFDNGVPAIDSVPMREADRVRRLLVYVGTGGITFAHVFINPEAGLRSVVRYIYMPLAEVAGYLDHAYIGGIISPDQAYSMYADTDSPRATGSQRFSMFKSRLVMANYKVIVNDAARLGLKKAILPSS